MQYLEILNSRSAQNSARDASRHLAALCTIEYISRTRAATRPRAGEGSDYVHSPDTTDHTSHTLEYEDDVRCTVVRVVRV